ncbi:MAG: hypothetical protein ACYSU0_09510 [Planctomycetota bacterium]|jgi:hypothetical protein
MTDCILVGNDVHDKNLLLKVGVDSSPPETRGFAKTAEGRRATLAGLRRLKKKAKASRVVLAYEASGAGYECRVLAPTRMKRSRKSRRMGTDERDAGGARAHLREEPEAGKIATVAPLRRPRMDAWANPVGTAFRLDGDSLMDASVVDVCRRRRAEMPWVSH